MEAEEIKAGALVVGRLTVAFGAHEYLSHDGYGAGVVFNINIVVDSH